MANLKVLMMGGRRCGKTTVLSSMFQQMTDGVVNNYFTIADDTTLENKGGETQDSLIAKHLELTSFLGKRTSKTFLVDGLPTNHYWDYYLKLQIPGTSDHLTMQFRDANGEFFEAGGEHSGEIKQYISECDVFVIVVDTPYLMGCVEDGTKDICSEAISLGVNCVRDIQGFLTNIEDHSGQDSKMVLFVPVKCEKWVREGRIDDVTARVKSAYGNMIKALSNYQKLTVGIIPIETAGNIVFTEFKEALKITRKNGTTKRGCRVSDTIWRFEDGTVSKREDTDVVNLDDKAIIGKTNLIRPYAWYSLNPKDSSYNPKNCEQIPLHILEFMICKYREAERVRADRSLFERIRDWFASLWNRLCEIFYKVKVDEVEEKLRKMRGNSIIKYAGDGIEFIRRCY